MDEILKNIGASTEVVVDVFPQVLAAILVLVGMFLLGRLSGNILLRIMKKSELSATHQKFFRKLLIGLFMVIGVSVALNILGLKAASMGLLTGGGITALAIGIAFKDIGENILAGIYMAFSKPFTMGDLIATGEFEGTVRDVELRHTHIRTYDGSDIFVPNAKIFSDALVNYTRDGLRRISFTVGIDYADDARRACSLLQARVRTLDKVLQSPEAVVSINGLTPQYVELKIYYWINTFDKAGSIWDIKSNVMDTCRKVLIENGFTFSSDVATANVLTVPEPVKIVQGDK